MSEKDFLVKLRAVATSDRCPLIEKAQKPGKDADPDSAPSVLDFTLRPGSCVHLRGKSGAGKTTIASQLIDSLAKSGSHRHALQNQLHLNVDVEWNKSIPLKERCGVLFQQTTLLDELTIAGNISVALTLHKDKFSSQQQRQLRIKQLLDSVGLEYHTVAGKRPTELSGGMARRASLAVQLAQHKRVIVLDEPFTGLDLESAISVANELVHLRQRQDTAFLLISHEPHLAKIVMDPSKTTDNQIVELTTNTLKTDEGSDSYARKPRLFGTSFRDRFLERTVDYTMYSLPLIVLAFGACGLAIAMLTADQLQRLEINDQVLRLVESEVRPLIKLLTGEDATTLQMLGIKMKVKSMLNQTVPTAKASLFAIGLSKLFVLEIGPLLTALLLCGRIGGSYAGKVAMLQATSQDKLLRTLGISPQWWTLWPSLLAAVIASPVLTMAGTCIALVLGGWMGPRRYGVGTVSQFWEDCYDSVFPVLRLGSFSTLWQSKEGMKEDGEIDALFGQARGSNVWNDLLSGGLDLRVTYNTESEPTWVDSFIEISTYPPIFHLIKAQVFILVILGVAEFIARLQTNLTPRGVPSVITFSVVSAGLLVILTDWGFSRLWLLRN